MTTAVVVLAALAVGTRHIGLIATATTTYNEPFNIARRFATIEHISNGRAGWNLVTSQTEDEAGNFNLDEHVAHALRRDAAQRRDRGALLARGSLGALVALLGRRRDLLGESVLLGKAEEHGRLLQCVGHGVLPRGSGVETMRATAGFP